MDKEIGRNERMAESQETECLCGKFKFWLTEGEITKNACPNCNRRYKGKYNPKTLHIEKIEV